MEKDKKDYEPFGDDLMNMIIAKTFSRHAGMTEEEYLQEIGFAGSGKTEDEAVRIAFMNVLVKATKELLAAKQAFITTKETIKMCLQGE